MQNVIFDLGGVVLDWNPDAIIRSIYADASVQALVKREIFEHPDWLETDRGTLTRAEAVVRWAERTGRPVEEIQSLMTATDVSMRLKTDTLALMDALADRGLDLYCLSNMPTERYDYLRRTHDFWGKFKGIIISAHLKTIKPEPEIFQYLLTTYRLDPAATLFVDDSARNIRVARSMGIRGILFTSADACRKTLDVLLKP
jgi:putative hydrolase of the HAD superfamily